KNALNEQGIPVIRMRAFEQASWMLIDANGIICHVFHKDERVYYNLERLCGDADEVSVAENNLMTYQGIAQVYDVLMEYAPYNKWVYLTEEIIKNHHILIEKVLDLGCGTGEITLRLAKKGYDISGVDLSADMLRQAATQSIEEQIDVTWVHQDIRQLEGFTN